MEPNPIPIRLSFSTLEDFNRCERYFQLNKLLATDDAREESADLSFGTAYGVGIAEYFLSQDADLSIYKGWLAYWPEIETDKKNVWRMVQALQASFPVVDNLLMDYEMLVIDGKPARELSFRINLTPDYYYVGYIDFVLRHRYDGTCVVWDAKTTGLQLLDLSPNYQNSAQGIGYSIALDAIVGEKLAHYAIGYFVAQLLKDAKVKVQPLVFKKTLLDRLNWLMTLGGDLSRLEQAASLDFYPRRGSGCLKFNRQCKHFGVCNMSSLDIPRIREPDIIQYDFVFELDDLIADHLRRVG